MHLQFQIDFFPSFHFLCQFILKIFEFVPIESRILRNEIFQIVCPIKAICNCMTSIIGTFFISFSNVMDAVFNLQTTIMLFQMQVSFGCKQPSKVIGSILISVSFILCIRQKILLHTVRHSIIVIFVFQLFF